MWTPKTPGLAYLAVTGLRSGLSGEIKVHDNLLLLLHLLLLFYGIIADAIQSAIIVARVEILVVKLASWSPVLLLVSDLGRTDHSKHTQL